MTTTNPPAAQPQEGEPNVTMPVDELLERHPLPWSHHSLLIRDANGRQVIHTGGSYNDRGRIYEGRYLSGLNALLVQLVNARADLPRATAVSRDVAIKLLAIRDAVASENYTEAYHQLYSIADPGIESLTPWANLEAIAAGDTPRATGETTVEAARIWRKVRMAIQTYDGSGTLLGIELGCATDAELEGESS